MNDGEWIGKIHSSMDRQCKARGYAAPVDVLMDAGVLSKQKYEEWRLGRVPFLESVVWSTFTDLPLFCTKCGFTPEKTD